MQLTTRHFIRFDTRVRGWVVIAKSITGNRVVVSRPRTANAADDKRLEFNKFVANGRMPLYERVAAGMEVPD